MPHGEPTQEARRADELLPLVYDALRKLARSYLRRRSPAISLEPTPLVHEAYLRLAQGGRRWRDKSHFYAVAAMQMRHVLVDHVRAAGAQKRRSERVTLDDRHGLVEDGGLNVLAVNEALSLLGRHCQRQERVAEMRLFTGMTVVEIARVLGVSERTVKYDWRHARAWLTRHLRGS